MGLMCRNRSTVYTLNSTRRLTSPRPQAGEGLGVRESAIWLHSRRDVTVSRIARLVHQFFLPRRHLFSGSLKAQLLRRDFGSR